MHRNIFKAQLTCMVFTSGSNFTIESAASIAKMQSTFVDRATNLTCYSLRHLAPLNKSKISSKHEVFRTSTRQVEINQPRFSSSLLYITKQKQLTFAISSQLIVLRVELFIRVATFLRIAICVCFPRGFFKMYSCHFSMHWPTHNCILFN